MQFTYQDLGDQAHYRHRVKLVDVPGDEGELAIEFAVVNRDHARHATEQLNELFGFVESLPAAENARQFTVTGNAAEVLSRVRDFVLEMPDEGIEVNDQTLAELLNPPEAKHADA